MAIKTFKTSGHEIGFSMISKTVMLPLTSVKLMTHVSACYGRLCISGFHTCASASRHANYS